MLLHFGAERGTEAGLCIWQTLAVLVSYTPFPECPGIVSVLFPHPCHFCSLFFNAVSRAAQASV